MYSCIYTICSYICIICSCISFVWPHGCLLIKHKNRSKRAKRNLCSEVLQELKASVFKIELSAL